MLRENTRSVGRPGGKRPRYGVPAPRRRHSPAHRQRNGPRYRHHPSEDLPCQPEPITASRWGPPSLVVGTQLADDLAFRLARRDRSRLPAPLGEQRSSTRRSMRRPPAVRCIRGAHYYRQAGRHSSVGRSGSGGNAGRGLGDADRGGGALRVLEYTMKGGLSPGPRPDHGRRSNLMLASPPPLRRSLSRIAFCADRSCMCLMRALAKERRWTPCTRGMRMQRRIRERRRRIAAPGIEPSCEGVGVLERLARTLSRIQRHHRAGRIADDLDAAAFVVGEGLRVQSFPFPSTPLTSSSATFKLGSGLGSSAASRRESLE